MSAKQGIPPRSESYADWYNELVLRAGLADYSPVRGCMIIKPHGYAIWELMQKGLDDMFKATGHQNAYFPLFIPESFLQKEADHVEGFAPQCAVVTHGGGEELAEPLYVRPTSETVIWNSYKNWIQSYRDLPILINQWANVVRWEKRTKLFLRTTEFLWQEGHTAHETDEDAEAEALQMVRIYQRFAEEWMALPVIVGKKTEIEKFAGANHTYCIEAMTQDLRAVQAGTSHHLGQNFAKAFDVQFQSREGSLEYVYATSWGVSTRLIGTLIMAHSDDKGLILPPRLAPVQVAIVPISRNDEARAEILQAAEKIAEELRNTQSFGEPIRVTIDRREKETPGFKFNDWEMKGACIRIEVGPRDLEESAVPVVERDTGEKQKLSLSDLSSISTMLEAQQRRIYEKALALRENNTRRVDTWEEFEKIFDVEGGAGFVLAHWDGTSETEQKIAELTKATIRCIPLEPLSPEDAQPGKCVLTGKQSERRVVFAKSY
jgi:prolyl-tRNA synthetase